MALLEKTQKVLTLEVFPGQLQFSNLRAIQEDNPSVNVANARDETGRLAAGVFTVNMTYAEWDDLGQPDQITVTVQPGDTLN